MTTSPPPSPESGRFAKRFLLGALVIVLLAGAATTVFILNEVGKVTSALNVNPTLPLPGGVLAPSVSGQPQTLLLVGDDRRPAPKGRPNGFVVPHSNEMLLVRLDPKMPTISMLSIPRDLQVSIHPPGASPTVKRINVAYTIGGIGLMTQTIKQVLGLAINHVVVITFPHFKRAVDRIGCVYTTVDRRYYHTNVGASANNQYFEINLRPGYQRLCGQHALEFVAYRHGDTAMIRDARDQRFLLDAKAEYGSELLANRDKFVQILGRLVQTDIHGTSNVLDLLALLSQMHGHPVRQVHFDANIGPIFVTASKQQIHRSVEAFLRGTAPLPQQHLAPIVHRARRRRRSPAPRSLTPTRRLDLAAARATARRLPFAIEYPRVRNQFAGAQADTLRLYSMRDPQGHIHPAYTIVIDRGRLGEFYDVQGTTWQNPPLLNAPTKTVKIGPRTYGLYYEGGNLRTVAWRDGRAVYWVENTLTDTVPPREMLAIARQTTPVVRNGRGTDAQPRNFGFSQRASSASTSTTLSTVWGLLDLIALSGVGFLTAKVVQQRRELKQLRRDCELMHRPT